MASDLTKVPGKPSLRYAKGRGIYRLVKVENKAEETSEVSWEPDEILHWCPRVLRYIVTKDSRGKITSARYTVEVAGHEDTIFAEELRSGEGWDRFPQASGHHDRQIKDTLACIVTHQAAQLPQSVAAPYWDNGQLVLSDPDLMPIGYAERAGEDLAEILPTIEQNPKLALVLGMAYGAPYVQPLRRQPFWLHLTGAAREGKSTGLNLAAAMWGRPQPLGDAVILPWNTTGVGLGAALGELAVLPAFLDDLHAAGFTALQIRKMIFATAQGNSRLRSTRTGRRRSSEPWSGVLFSTGNDSILSMIPTAEVAARVVEIPSPLTADSATSKKITNWAQSNYGHFMARAVPAVTMSAHVDQAEALLRGTITGGTEETIMENLALGVAGAYAVGGKPLADAALHAAREILDILKVELAESGVKPGDKLLEAVRQYLVSRPGAFPTRQEYGAALVDTSRPAPAVQGFWEPPVAYIITSHMAGIAAAYGIPDPRVGLRELKKAKLLDTQASANQLRKQVRAAGRRFDSYAIRLEDTGEETSPTPPPGKFDSTSDTSATSDTAGQTLWEPSLVQSDTSDTPAFAQVNTATQPVTPQVESTPTDAAAVTGPVTLDTPDRIAPGMRSTAPGEPGDTGPVTRRPVRAASASSHAEDSEEWDRWTEIIRSEDAWPQATTEQCLAGLRAFQRALGGLRHLGTSAVAGQLLFHKVLSQHGSIPELQEGGMPVDLEEVARTFNYVITDAPVAAHPWVASYDVNAQFLAATGSVELGTGYAEEVTVPAFTTPREAKRYFGKPGYVQLSSDTPIAGSCVLPEGSWIAHPVAGYLAERGALSVAPRGFLWPSHRRWLSAWGDKVRRARTALMDRPGDLAAQMALHALKLMYAAFLGGFLRSEAYNRSRTLRWDWNDHLVGLARVNMLRALDKCSPRPFATHLDAAYFLLDDNQVVAGLQITPQAGKWKVAKVGRAQGPATIIRGGRQVRTTLAEQTAAGSVAGVRDVVAALDAQRREVAA